MRTRKDIFSLGLVFGGYFFALKRKRRTAPPLKEKGAVMKEYKLYERGVGMVAYEKAAYEELLRIRQRTCVRMRRQGRCVCPKNSQWRCDGNCDGCPYEKVLDVFLQQKIAGADNLTLEDVLTDGGDYESVCTAKLHSETVLARLDEIMPQARKIGELRLLGYSDRDIAKELGISRTSMYRLLAKAQEALKKEFGEI